MFRGICEAFRFGVRRIPKGPGIAVYDWHREG